MRIYELHGCMHLRVLWMRLCQQQHDHLPHLPVETLQKRIGDRALTRLFLSAVEQLQKNGLKTTKAPKRASERFYFKINLPYLLHREN